MKSLKEILDEHFVPAVGYKDRPMKDQRNAAFAQMTSFIDDIWQLTECFDSEELMNQLESIAEEEHLFDDDDDELSDDEEEDFSWAQYAEEYEKKEMMDIMRNPECC